MKLKKAIYMNSSLIAIARFEIAIVLSYVIKMHFNYFYFSVEI